MNIRFGTAGIPHCAPQNCGVPSGIKEISQYGLDHMEVEFVYGARMSESIAKDVLKSSEKYSVSLSVHAPYYINLASSEAEKAEASVERILKSARLAQIMGASSVTFHAGFYQKRPAKKVIAEMIKNFTVLFEKLEEEKISVEIRPETTGKPSQFGSIDEIIILHHEFSQIIPCIDFSHLHARRNGTLKTREDYCRILDILAKNFGDSLLSNMHMHISGIAYNQKGEIKHLPLRESDMNYQALLEALHQYNVKGFAVCESPLLEEDALLLKNYYSAL